MQLQKRRERLNSRWNFKHKQTNKHKSLYNGFTHTLEESLELTFGRRRPSSCLIQKTAELLNALYQHMPRRSTADKEIPFREITNTAARANERWHKGMCDDDNDDSMKADLNKSNYKKTKNEQQKKKKTVGFVSSQPTEVITFRKDEPTENNLGNIMSHEHRSASFVPMSPLPKKRQPSSQIEEVI